MSMFYYFMHIKLSITKAILTKLAFDVPRFFRNNLTKNVTEKAITYKAL